MSVITYSVEEYDWTLCQEEHSTASVSSLVYRLGKVHPLFS